MMQNKVSFIHMQNLVHLHVNKTYYLVKSIALGLALKQRQRATQKMGYCRTVLMLLGMKVL